MSFSEGIARDHTKTYKKRRTPAGHGLLPPQWLNLMSRCAFSATPKTRNKIKSEFLDLLKRVEETVQNSDLEEAYQMSFDLFSWTEKKS